MRPSLNRERRPPGNRSTQITERCLSSTEGAGWDQPPPEGTFTEAVLPQLLLLLCSNKGRERLQGSSDLVGDMLSRTCEPVMVRSLPAAAVAADCDE